MHWGWRVVQPPNLSYAYFYCHENDAPNPDNDPNFKPLCTDKDGKDTDVTAYTWNDIGTFWKAHYVVLCPQFFSSELSSLAVAVQTAEKDHIMQNTIDYWRPIRARSIFHETYHWEYTVSDPLTWDESYDPAEIVQLPLKDQVRFNVTPRLQREDVALMEIGSIQTGRRAIKHGELGTVRRGHLLAEEVQSGQAPDRPRRPIRGRPGFEASRSIPGQPACRMESTSVSQ